VGKLKTITLAVLLTAGAAVLATAGPGGRGAKGPERIKARVEKMQQNLALTDGQARQIEAILTEAAAQHQGARNEGDGDREARREHMREQRRATMERIQAVLNDEQRAKFQQMQEDRKGRHRKGKGQGGDRDQF
jgi:Spy/CpxP family protein refolding chaperone